MEIIAEVIAELVLSRLLTGIWRWVVRLYKQGKGDDFHDLKDKQGKVPKRINQPTEDNTSEPDSASSERRLEALPPEEHSQVLPGNEMNERIRESH